MCHIIKHFPNHSGNDRNSLSVSSPRSPYHALCQIERPKKHCTPVRQADLQLQLSALLHLVPPSHFLCSGHQYLKVGGDFENKYLFSHSC